MTRIELLAVDLDGTLVDSAPDLAHCVDRVLESLGLEPSGEVMIRSWIGDGVETLLERALVHATGREPDAAMRRSALDSFSSCYRLNLFERSRLYPGVRETLAALGDRGIRLACITNKRLEFADHLLEEAGIRAPFELLLGGDSLAEKKPSPLPLLTAARSCAVAPASAAMVGDSHHDYRAACAAGYRFFWAAYGYCRTIESDPAKPFTQIGTFGELERLAA